MKKPTEGTSISRRTLLVTTSLALIAPVEGLLSRPAAAAAPKSTYGYGYTGGY